jgi:translation initiation factor IF-3
LSIVRPNFDRERSSQQGPRINHRIRVPQVRVVNADGEMLGVLDTSEALRLAREGGLDLVEVNPKAFPPVCKIMDFGKFKYEEKKRQAEARKRQATVELKEIKLRPKTDDHDIEVKVRHILRFLSEGDKVKVTCRFRGREITHPEMAERQLHEIVERVGANCSVEAPPKMEGRTMTLLLAPPRPGGGGGAARPRPRPASDADGPSGPSGPGSAGGPPPPRPAGPTVERR